jgi:hypothetical protein
MGTHPEIFSGRAYGRRPSRTQTSADAALCCGFSTLVRNGTCRPQSYPNYKTVHWRFQTWCSNEIPRRVLTDVANELRDKVRLMNIDATFVMTKGGGVDVGATKRGKGMKFICGPPWIALSVSTHAANHQEVPLVRLCFEIYMIEAKPRQILISLGSVQTAADVRW